MGSVYQSHGTSSGSDTSLEQVHDLTWAHVDEPESETDAIPKGVPYSPLNTLATIR